MTAAEVGIVSGCTACGGACTIVDPETFRRCRIRCPHCGHVIPDSTDLRVARSRTAAFCLSALILYPPAVLLPVLRIDRLGHAHESGILDGIGTLFSEGHGWLALIVLVCSVVIPLAKLLGLLVLSTTRIGVGTRVRWRMWRTIEVIGRWGMLDVLLVAALVALVKIGDLVRIEPGSGTAIFAMMVVFSLLASACFDARAVRMESDS